MKKRTLSWFMALALGTGALAGALAGTAAVQAETQEETEADEAAAKTADAEEATDEAESDVLKNGGLKGPTAMGMGQPFDDDKYEFTIAASPDEIVPMIV